MSKQEEPLQLSPEQMAKVQEAIDSKKRGEPSYSIEQVMEHIQSARTARQLERGA
ncbi:MAG: hypothetical protein QE269_12530 [Fimbriimonas sp.]|jgi:hypothetical protein|nr:hypothetical protein [Fimbriimonas sp.]